MVIMKRIKVAASWDEPPVALIMCAVCEQQQSVNAFPLFAGTSSLSPCSSKTPEGHDRQTAAFTGPSSGNLTGVFLHPTLIIFYISVMSAEFSPLVPSSLHCINLFWDIIYCHKVIGSIIHQPIVVALYCYHKLMNIVASLFFTPCLIVFMLLCLVLACLILLFS